MKLNPYLKKFWKTKKQIKVLYGGRMSSKTEDTAGVLSYIASKYKVRVACLRRFQSKIDESVYSILKRKILDDEYLRPQFKVNKSTIESTSGSEFVFLGIQRNIEEIKGLDDIDITWIEEAEKLTKEQWDLIRPTILRKENSFCVLVFNPYLVTDFIYQEFVVNPKENVLIQKINYENNPFLSNSALDIIRVDKKSMTDKEFSHVYLGEPLSDDDGAIIKRSWVNASIDAHIKLGIDVTGRNMIGFDVADDGADANSTTHTKGFYCFDVKEWRAGEDELLKSATKVFNMAIEEKAHINYDCIGVGASMGSKFKELNTSNRNVNITFSKFHAGEKPINPDREYQYNIKNKDAFSNLKAQAWQNIADRFRKTYNAVINGDPISEDELISISGTIENLDSLITELSTPKKEFDNNGKMKVESKKDLKARGIPSHNNADSFIMAYFKGKSNPLLEAMMSD